MAENYTRNKKIMITNITAAQKQTHRDVLNSPATESVQGWAGR